MLGKVFLIVQGARADVDTFLSARAERGVGVGRWTEQPQGKNTMREWCSALPIYCLAPSSWVLESFYKLSYLSALSLSLCRRHHHPLLCF